MSPRGPRGDLLAMHRCVDGALSSRIDETLARETDLYARGDTFHGRDIFAPVAGGALGF
jgi:S-adenosylmethionine hydrolase